ncbi:MAG: hypothetical protein ABNH53_05410 [Henriciella sp.]|jgi:hypothetical protein
MKKILISALVAGLCAVPALAASMTLSFAADSGETQAWTLNDDGTATSGDLSVPYTWDETGGVLCATTAEGELCATIADASTAPSVGDSSTYTTNSGQSGTVTITAMTE